MDALRVLSVDWRRKLIVLSTGEEVFTPWQDLVLLCEDLRADQAVVEIRTAWTPRGTELIEIHRLGAAPTDSVTWPEGVF